MWKMQAGGKVSRKRGRAKWKRYSQDEGIFFSGSTRKGRIKSNDMEQKYQALK
jgi:hypothetical protein